MIKIPYPDETLPQVDFADPTTDGFLVVAAEVDRRPAWLPDSRRKRRLLARVGRLAQRLEADELVREVTVFDARFFAPMQRKRNLRDRLESSGKRVGARFDLVVLVRTSGTAAAQELAAEPGMADLVDEVRTGARLVTVTAGSNVRRIGDVAHDGRAVFLFNFFYAEDEQAIVPVWEHSARWFVARTHIRNSMVLRPLAGQDAHYGVVNHASWPRWRDFLPHLALRPSFRTYVNGNTVANGLMSRPGLYRQVATSQAGDLPYGA